ncbi:MAG: hypothetical protein ACREJ6_09770 [Candidatus Methylomirabilis sp.]
MIATTVDQRDRDKEYKKKFEDRRVWALAPVDRAVMKSGVEMPGGEGERPIPVDYWTREMIDAFFSRNGRVNEIWGHYGIQLTLLRVEDCEYHPEALRPDGLVRDSMPTPQTSIPWAGQLFRSINRLFTQENPNVLHVFLWWSVAESEIGGADWGTFEEHPGGNRVWGYSRSAARGGPAVWLGAYGCLTPDGTIDYQRRCAKLVAHEVGHAFGLQHVERPRNNLMYKNPATGYKDPGDPGTVCNELGKACEDSAARVTLCADQREPRMLCKDPARGCEDLAVGVILCADQQEQALREAREQFRSK